MTGKKVQYFGKCMQSKSMEMHENLLFFSISMSCRMIKTDGLKEGMLAECDV